MKTKKIGILKNEQVTRKIGIVVCLFLLGLVFTILTRKFLTVSNIVNVLQQATINGCVALGMTLVIITGGIDLSVGSIMALSGMIMAQLMVAGTPVGVALLAGVLLGVACGAVNGILISKIKLQPFLVTLGTMSVYRGVTLIISDGLPVRGLPGSFSNMMNALNRSFPVPIIILLVFTVILFLVVKYSKYGQYVFAIGGNEEATRLSGINTGLVKVGTYAISGLACSLAAIIFLGRLAAADPQAGASYEMNAIAAAAIGGASLAGGKGSLIGTIIGVLILQTLNNGLTLLNVQSFYQTLAIGLIIIAATIIDRYSSK